MKYLELDWCIDLHTCRYLMLHFRPYQRHLLILVSEQPHSFLSTVLHLPTVPTAEESMHLLMDKRLALVTTQDVNINVVLLS